MTRPRPRSCSGSARSATFGRRPCARSTATRWHASSRRRASRTRDGRPRQEPPLASGSHVDLKYAARLGGPGGMLSFRQALLALQELVQLLGELLRVGAPAAVGAWEVREVGAEPLGQR